MNETLAPLFSAVGQALRQYQSELNAADPYNANHGDHMVQIFDMAARAVEQSADAPLADQMEQAAAQLAGLTGNSTAQVYAQGLKAIAGQLRRHDITLDDLLTYVRRALAEDNEPDAAAQANTRSGVVLKALMAGLAAWSKNESGSSGTPYAPVPDDPLDMGSLFELGMAYMQAKQRGGSRLEVLSDAAASVTPLSKVDHRYQSGKLAVESFLRAIQTHR